MRLGLFVCGALLLPIMALAQPAPPAGRINPGGPMIPAGPDAMHFCYYAGKPFSRGALIKNPAGGLLRCSGDTMSAFNSNRQPRPLEWQGTSSSKEM